MSESPQSVYIPPMAKATLQAPDDNVFPLMNNVKEFIDGEKQVMLILGDSGSGKSVFNRQLEYELWQDYKYGDPIPLLINLPAHKKPMNNLVAEQLQVLNFSEAQIQQMKQHHQVILICDSYDESQLVSNLHMTNRLNRSEQWSAKLIITCRTQYLGPEYRGRFMPMVEGQCNQPANHLFQEAVIAPWSMDQIGIYVEQYVPLEPRTWTIKDYMYILSRIPNLMDLVKNPFLLSLALEALPDVTEGKQELSAITITRVQLYDTFVNHWLVANKRRLMRNDALSVDNRDMLNQLVTEGFISLSLDYATRLALAIFEWQDGNPVVTYSHFRDKNTWKAEFFGADARGRLLRDSSLLIRRGNQYQFVHKSMLEYFLSRAVFDPSRFAPSSSLVPFIVEPLDAVGPLFKRNLLSEPSVIQFLSERVQQCSDFKTQLLAVVEQSKTDVTAVIAAINAITILVRSSIHFHGTDLRNIRIPGADLSNGQFDSVQFQGADLTGVNFSRCWLRQANFDGAHLSEVQFGERAVSCSFSFDGRILTIGMSDGTVKLWNASTENIFETRYKQSTLVSDIIFSPNYQHIAFTTTEFSIRLWDTDARQPLQDLVGHTDRVVGIAFSPNGHQLVSCSKDRSVRLWNLKTRTFDLIFYGFTGNTNIIIFSPSGRRIALASSDGTCRIWNVEDHCAGAVLQGHAAGVTAVAFSPCESFVATGSADKIIKTWNAGSRELQYIITGHERSITALAYSPKGTWIVSGSSDGLVKLWSSESGMLGMELVGHSLEVTNLVFSPSDDLLISSSFDTTVRWWRIASGESGVILRESGVVLRGSLNEIESMTQTSVKSSDQDSERICTRHWSDEEVTSEKELKGRPSKVTGVAFSANGEHLFSGGYDGTLRSLDIQSAELQWARRGHEGTVTAVACSRHGDLISASLDHTVVLWDTAGGHIARVFRGHEASVTSVSFTPCGQRMVSGSADWTVRVWGLSSGAVIEKLVGHTQAVRSVAASPTGTQVASGSEDTTVRLWDLCPLGSKSVLLVGHTESVSCVAYSSDGTYVASASEDKTARVWKSTTGKHCFTLEGHTEGLLCVAFSPNGQWIVTGGLDNSLRLWRADSGWFLDVIEVFFGAVRSVSWSPDGTSFATGSDDRSVRVWRVLAEKEGIKIQLQWSPQCDVIVASMARIQGAVGLSSVNKTLLLQRGAVDGAGDLGNLEE